jgi:hypothetical protein
MAPRGVAASLVTAGVGMREETERHMSTGWAEANNKNTRVIVFPT